MRKLLMAVTLLAMTAGSCKKVDEATEFDLNYSTAIEMPASAFDTSGTVDFLSPEIPTESSSKFTAYGTAQHLIDEIKLTAFTVTNETGNLDFINSLSVFIQADGLGEELIARGENIPAGAQSLVAQPAGKNIKAHIFKDKIQLRLMVNFNSLPSEAQKLRLDQTLHVTGKKLSK